MRTLFYGTPSIAVSYLQLAAEESEVVAVITQPDRPVGRGLETKPTPVKEAALKLKLPVLQPERPSEIAAQIKSFDADLGIVIAYGQILKPDVLKAARLGHINVHFSLLPKYRGSAPVPWALVNGETKTGVSLFWLDEGMDTGPLLSQKEAEILPTENASQLMEKLEPIGLDLLKTALEQISHGDYLKTPQEGAPSYAPLLKKTDGLIDFENSAVQIHNLVRGLFIWPRAYFVLRDSPGDKRVSVLQTSLNSAFSSPFPAPIGTILRVEQQRGFLLQCGQGSSVWISRVQPEGKSPMGAAEFLNGRRLTAGHSLPLKRGK